MPKQILIIGGGISGLAVLHNLKIKYHDRSGIDIRLLEKNNYLGGTIRTLQEDGCLFETGPNGFLDSKETTLEFIRELGAETQLLPANPEAERRFIVWKGGLYRLPANPAEFFGFPPLSVRGKLRVLVEPFVPPRADPAETVYEFGCRRLGKEFTDIFLDPMVSGIFAGDVRVLNLKASFPRIHEIEQHYGSLLKGMMTLGRKKRKARGNPGQPTGRLTSFTGGMSQLIKILHDRYEDAILTGQDVHDVKPQGTQLQVCTATGNFLADELFVATPAYRAAELLKNFAPGLAARLSLISYAPIAVVGLVYKREAFGKLPEGFGYLIPSSENSEVLGVLFSSNIFPARSREDEFLFRAMIGGARHPQAVEKDRNQLLELAETEIKQKFAPTQQPARVLMAVWPQAIPQYNQDYPRLCVEMDNELQKTPNLHLAANYRGGISVNDCIVNAKRTVEESNFPDTGGRDRVRG